MILASGFHFSYDIRNQGYWHLAFATMATLSFDAMRCYSDVSRLKWSNTSFEFDYSSSEITFEIRKNAQFRQENKIIVATTNEEVCP